MKYYIVQKNKMSDEIRRYLNRQNIYEYRQSLKDKSNCVLISDEQFNKYQDKSSPNPEEMFEKKELIQAMRNLICTQLSKQEKAVIVHIYYEGHTQEETARIMQITQSSVSTYLKRALVKLQDKLHNFGY